MGLLELSSGSIRSLSGDEGKESSWTEEFIKDMAMTIAANKAAALGLGALGVTSPLAILGVGALGYGAMKGIQKEKTPYETVTQEMIPALGWQGAFEAGTRGLYRPLKSALKTQVNPLTGATSPGLIENFRQAGISKLLGSGEARWEALKPLRETFSATEIVPGGRGGFFGKLLKGSTVEDLFIPGAETIPETKLFGGKRIIQPAKDFMQDAALRAETAKHSADFGKAIQGLNMEERAGLYDAVTSVRGLVQNTKGVNVMDELATGQSFKGNAWDALSLDSQNKVLTSLKPFENLSKSMRNIYNKRQQQYVVDDFASQFLKMTDDLSTMYKHKVSPSVQGIANLRPAMTQINELQQQAAALMKTGDYGKANKLLRQAGKLAHGDPDIPIDVKNNIIFMADTPALGAELIYGAGLQSIRNTLFDQLKRYGRYTTDNANYAVAHGFVKVTGPAKGAFKDLWVEPSTAKAIMEIAEIPSEARVKWNKYFFSPWKMWRVIGRPASMVRNAFGNVVMNDLFGEHSLGPITGFGTYVRALKDLRSGGAASKELGKLAGVNYGGFMGMELKDMTHALKSNSNMLDVMLSVSNKASTPFVGAHNFFEAWAKTAKFMHNKEQGMKSLDAAIDAMRSTFNYGETTRFTKFARESFAPFATWQVKMARALPEAMVKRPLTFAKYVAIPYAISSYALRNLDISDQEWNDLKGDLPKYAKEKMFMLMPFRDDKGKLQLFDLTWWLPGLGDMSEMQQRYTTVSGLMQNPVWTIPSSLWANKKNNGAPIWYEWQDGGTKFSKAATYVYQNLSPTWIPGGTDFAQVWNAAREKPDTLTLAQSIASTAGFKVMPLLEAEVKDKKMKLDKMFERELVGQLKKELANATTDVEREAILRRYQGWLENLYSNGIE